jgi:tRNA (uracil-5-)-methyltransferase TRM9
MKTKIINKLNQLNLDFYQQFAGEFASAREYYWSGWEKLLPIISRFRSKKEITVADVGCGHGRFASFLSEKLSEEMQIDYNGFDNSSKLLELAKERVGGIERLDNTAFLHELDLLTQLQNNPKQLITLPNEPKPSFDLICLFGVFHHIPSIELRRVLIHKLIKQLTPDGLLIITFWDFKNFERFSKKIIDPKTVDIDPKELESNDYILDWKKGGTAYRYCHYATPHEVEELLQTPPTNMPYIKTNVVSSFSADGREGSINRYMAVALADQD